MKICEQFYTYPAQETKLTPQATCPTQRLRQSCDETKVHSSARNNINKFKRKANENEKYCIVWESDCQLATGIGIPSEIFDFRHIQCNAIVLKPYLIWYSNIFSPIINKNIRNFCGSIVLYWSFHTPERHSPRLFWSYDADGSSIFVPLFVWLCVLGACRFLEQKVLVEMNVCVHSVLYRIRLQSIWWANLRFCEAFVSVRSSNKAVIAKEVVSSKFIEGFSANETLVSSVASRTWSRFLLSFHI